MTDATLTLPDFAVEEGHHSSFARWFKAVPAKAIEVEYRTPAIVDGRQVEASYIAHVQHVSAHHFWNEESQRWDGAGNVSLVLINPRTGERYRSGWKADPVPEQWARTGISPATHDLLVSTIVEATRPRTKVTVHESAADEHAPDVTIGSRETELTAGDFTFLSRLERPFERAFTATPVRPIETDLKVATILRGRRTHKLVRVRLVSADISQRWDEQKRTWWNSVGINLARLDAEGDAPKDGDLIKVFPRFNDEGLPAGLARHIESILAAATHPRTVITVTEGAAAA